MTSELKIGNGKFCWTGKYRDGRRAKVCATKLYERVFKRTQCTDKKDNDGDGKTDWPEDPGCTDELDNSEGDSSDSPPPSPAPSGSPAPPPQCNDGYDNDSDGQVDYPRDLQCTAPSDPSEST